MEQLLEIIGKIGGGLRSVTGRCGNLETKLREIMELARTLTGSDAAGMGIWDREGRTIAAATGKMAGNRSKSIRKILKNPPKCPGEHVAKLGCRDIPKDEPITSGWEALDDWLMAGARDRHITIFSLEINKGAGLVILQRKEALNWPREAREATAVLIAMGISNIILKTSAETHSNDYRRMFQNSKDMIYLSTRDGRWIDVNPAGVELLGYKSARELLEVPDIGRYSYARVEDREKFMQAIEKDGFVRDYEVVFKKKDGTPVDVSITAQVRMEDGKVVGYEGIIKDITRRKKAEEQAAKDRRILTSILEVMPVAVFVIDKEHRVTHWNKACEELTGTGRDKVIGSRGTWKVFQRKEGISLADVLLESGETKLRDEYGRKKLRRSPISEEAWEAEDHFDNLGGREKELFFTAATLKGEGGEKLGAVEVIIDTSRLKKLERQLAESEALYRTLVESNREGILLFRDERFLFANQAFKDMFGLADLGNARGGLLDLISPANQRDYLAWIKTGKDAKTENAIFTGQGMKAGEPFDLELTANDTVYGGERTTLIIARDVTARRKMEERLIRSERLAATGKLAFDIAHEVNNPLGGILAYAHLLAEDLGEESEAYPTLDKIIKLTNRCKIIIRGLLDFARQEAYEQETLNINQVMKEMLNLIEGHVILREIKLEKNYSEEIPAIRGHRNKLEQVFLNLIINAAEAMEGKGSIEINTKPSEDHKRVVVSVSDTGPGMAEDVAKRIFEPFFTTKERGRGTGLGLAISHGIIKQHGGEIELETEPGKGSRFTITLPVERELPLC